MKSPFRSIRHKLFNEGKLLRYLGYAVGEIALIIIGIMLALQLNNWNEDRKAQAEFELYIIQLREDVKQAIIRVREASETLKKQAIDDSFILGFLKRSEYEAEDLESFKRHLRSLTYYRDPQIKVGLLSQLIDGKMEIIGLDKELTQIAQVMEGDVNRWLEIIRIVKDGLGPKWDTISKYRALPSDVIPDLEYSFDLDRMRSSTEFLYTVQGILTEKATVGNFSERIAVILEEFLTVLEEYE